MEAVERTMKTWDGTDIFYRAWLPPQPADRAVLLFHRGHEHSARWQETVDSLRLEGFALFAWDARGHGRSPGDRGAAGSLSDLVKDADAFHRHVLETYGLVPENTAILAHSVGAVVAAAWVHDYAPAIRCMVLATPAFRVKLYVPFAVPLLRLRRRLLGNGHVKSYVKSRVLTHDLEEARRYDADGLIFRQIAVNVLLDLHDASTRLLEDAGAITVPTLVLGAGSDWVVKLSAIERFFRGLSSTVKRYEVLPGFYHAVFHEKERFLPVRLARDFILDSFAPPPASASLLEADRGGFTAEERDILAAPGSWRHAAMRLALKTAGRLSTGIRLGWRRGFDSGATLDYVYEDRARGFPLLGRWIDRCYLDSAGWRGIRIRRKHIEKTLRAAIERVHAAGRPVHILDVASGPGRYVVETLRSLPATLPATALLRDYSRENVEAALQLARQMGLTCVAAEVGDAFDADSVAAVTPRPTIAIVSGLYELFPANEPIRRSLSGLARALEPGGFLVYTNQPWHPQLEFIARVLTNRDGKPWIMRRRTQAEMDELVQAAGFKKLAQEIDAGGIFSVSLAQRPSV